MASFAILFLCCTIAVVSPLSGLALLLVAEASLFHLYRFAQVPIGIGYVGLSDVYALVLLSGTFFSKRGFRDRCTHDPRERTNGEDSNDAAVSAREGDVEFCRRTLISALVPFLSWQAVCTVIGLMRWWGQPPFRFTVRYLFSGTGVWLLVPFVWIMRGRHRVILGIAMWTAVVTAAIHLLLQATDHRALMESAYWRYVPESEFLREERSLWLHESAFVRGSPQGIVLIVYMALLALSVGTARAKSKRWLATSVMMGVAIVLTFSRGVLLAFIVGAATLFVLWLSSTRSLRSFLHRYVTLLALGASVTLAVAMASVARPGVVSTWADRLKDLRVEGQFWSEETDTIRGQDNTAALRAIADSPMLGWGMPRYPGEYAPRVGPPDNIHPILMLALAGGWPNAALALRMFAVLSARFWRRSRCPAVRERLLPYFAVIASMLALNLTGAGGYAGGTFHGTPALVSGLLIGLMASEYLRAVRDAAS
jgi:hypothetical protein